MFVCMSAPTCKLTAIIHPKQTPEASLVASAGVWTACLFVRPVAWESVSMGPLILLQDHDDEITGEEAGGGRNKGRKDKVREEVRAEMRGYDVRTDGSKRKGKK